MVAAICLHSLWHSHTDDAERGAAFALHAKKKNTRYVAVGWNEPGKKVAKHKTHIKTLITTCLGNVGICAGQPIIRKRTKGKRTTYIEIPQPLAVEGYTKHGNAIAVHNQYGRASLKLDFNGTKSHLIRHFQGVMSFTGVNVYMAYEFYE